MSGCAGNDFRRSTSCKELAKRPRANQGADGMSAARILIGAPDGDCTTIQASHTVPILAIDS
jgi:hypothetical protein